MQTFKTTSCTAVVRNARIRKHTAHPIDGLTIYRLLQDTFLDWTTHSIDCMDEFLKSAEHVNVHVYISCVVNVYVRACMQVCVNECLTCPPKSRDCVRLANHEFGSNKVCNSECHVGGNTCMSSAQ